MVTFNEVRKKARLGNVIPVCEEMPADLLTPVSAYMRISAIARKTAGGAQSFLLESVEGGENLARYSFLGINPRKTLVIRNGQLKVSDGMKFKSKHPMLALREFFNRYKSAGLDELPSFSGGTIGYLGYECIQYLESVPVVGRPASQFDAYLKVYGTLLVFDHVKRRVLLVGNIFKDEEKLEAGYRRVQRELKELKQALMKPSKQESEGFASTGVASAEEMSFVGDRKRFHESVSTIKKHIRRGDIFQCVLSEPCEFQLKAEPFALYRSLRRLSPSPYLVYLQMQDDHLVTASPEMLVKCQDGQMETCPIAGTRPRGATHAQDVAKERDLLASVKEKAEHLMLVDLSRNDLGRVSAPGTVRVEKFMNVERFSHVMHLVSHVHGKLKSGKTAWDALLACFPAGTLSGAPKIRAMEIISRLEPRQRGPYGGAVIYHDFSGNLNSCITIRSLFAQGKKASIQAGAGVVADSQAEREYQEIISKTRAMRRAVADAERGGK